jgi:hypothetical protein
MKCAHCISFPAPGTSGCPATPNTTRVKVPASQFFEGQEKAREISYVNKEIDFMAIFFL